MAKEGRCENDPPSNEDKPEEEKEEEQWEEEQDEEEEEEDEGVRQGSYRGTAGDTGCDIDDVLTATEDATAGSSSSPTEPLSSPSINNSVPTTCPPLPPLAPQALNRWPHLGLQLPPSFHLDLLDPMAVYAPTCPSNAILRPGLSARMWWALFLAWKQRWGFQTGMSQPLLDLISVYVRACFFQEETLLFLTQLQLLILILLPWYAVCPSWLWWVLYGRHF